MEYLVTYGWALMVLFVVVAYLLTTGAFSANSFASQECVFQPDLPCYPFVLYRDGGATTLKFTLANGLGFPINVSSINYTTVGIGAPGRMDYPDTPATRSRGIIQSGDRMYFNYTFTSGSQPSANDFRTLFVTFSYLNCKNPAACSGPYVTTGRISSVVEAGTASPVN